MAGASCYAGVVWVVILAVRISASGSETITSNSSCVQVYPNVLKNDYFCNRYVGYPKGYCSPIVGNAHVYGTKESQRQSEKGMQVFQFGKTVMEDIYGLIVRETCMEVFNASYCRWSFPRCDYTTGKLMKKPICYETCKYGMKQCDKEFEMARNFNKINQGQWPYQWNIMECDNGNFPRRNGGDNPSCYYIPDLITETDKLLSSDCYYGEGVGYRGNISVTKSGITCQSWSSQCPHRHYHNSTQYPELVNAANFCRNPGGMGPDGPWCYTTNMSMRWEYCDVPKCPPPGPTKPPTSTRAYATGPNSILIEWKPVPLPFVHGTPQGYRIMIKEVTADRYMISNTTGAAVLRIEFQGLKPLTNYSLVVMEFNEHRDGTPSSPVYVMTMPTNSVRVRFIVTLGNKLFSAKLLDRTTPEYKALEKQVKESVIELYKEAASELYYIHQIEVIKFTNGSVRAHFDVTAGFNQSLTDAETVSEAVVGAMVTVPRIGALSVNQTRVTGPPPAPRRIHAAKIETTSLSVRWQAPVHSETYTITNYTVMFKKATSSLNYLLAGSVDEGTREFQLNDLDPETEYKIRVATHNQHGKTNSEPIRATTEAKPNIALILGIVIPVVILVVIVVAFSVLLRRWWKKKRKLEDAFALERANREAMEDHYQSANDVLALLGLEGAVKEWWEIPRGDLTIDKELGSGAFGVVKKASLKIREKSTEINEKDEGIGEEKENEEPEEEGKVLEIVQCAVKMLKDNPTERELRDLCNEIAIMALVGDHPNIVSLLGACTVNGPLWLVVKLAENGCFLDYIKMHRSVVVYENTENKIHSYENVTDKSQVAPMTEKEKFKFAYEIAKGMRHLEQKKCVHRDLAARNILLNADNVAMVSDFGLSRDVYESGAYDNTTGGVLPVRWMAIESLEDYTYTTKSDVWSYGVLLWEMESGGLMPYAGMSGVEILERLKQGYRLEKPSCCSQELYAIMYECWNPEPKNRPSFLDIVHRLEEILRGKAGYEEILPEDGKGETPYDEVHVDERFLTEQDT
ncbi:tyrosine-protein kinase Mer [Nematostella vectensis]|uniref:tyrosine-protein kinase Mer n=1 Tax=Nematostella vectensis TaxID=45351 RepID=UPI0020777129|nr:tyrosine-protein kinase Mer [Nematostella vectensis]XP_048579993.1 tyrosine-protein kinase Mer [Nematostella vectensis]